MGRRSGAGDDGDTLSHAARGAHKGKAVDRVQGELRGCYLEAALQRRCDRC